MFATSQVYVKYYKKIFTKRFSIECEVLVILLTFNNQIILNEFKKEGKQNEGFDINNAQEENNAILFTCLYAIKGFISRKFDINQKSLWREYQIKCREGYFQDEFFCDGESFYFYFNFHAHGDHSKDPIRKGMHECLQKIRDGEMVHNFWYYF